MAAANAVIDVNRQRLKTAHPIRIDARRRREPPGGRWQRLDPLAGGRGQVLAVPPDAIGQAAVVMAEVERLAALDPSADGSDIALLARNRATLELIRAWCENAGIACAVGEGEQNGGPSLHQVREGCHLADFLRGKANRLLRCGTLARWFAARHRAAISGNPWCSFSANSSTKSKRAGAIRPCRPVWPARRCMNSATKRGMPSAAG
ncbi:hypothetical protein [Accumulibacter sp.]|uniref:hypothetical protein n=1 Tax=Accumulibacter sp. TaxID=2053492 RepID=UPI002C307A2F|nr:hypothetical protein [Accumulibacter sp.]HNB68713.1 hypothetical protein [Accumulibacter sp.]